MTLSSLGVTGIAAMVALGGSFTVGTIVQDNACKAHLYLVDQAVSTQVAVLNQQLREAEELRDIWQDKAEIQAKAYEDTLNEEHANNLRLIASVNSLQQGSNQTCSLPKTGKPKAPSSDNAGARTGTRILSKEDKEFLAGIALECDRVTKNAALMRGWLQEMHNSNLK